MCILTGRVAVFFNNNACNIVAAYCPWHVNWGLCFLFLEHISADDKIMDSLVYPSISIAAGWLVMHSAPAPMNAKHFWLMISWHPSHHIWNIHEWNLPPNAFPQLGMGTINRIFEYSKLFRYSNNYSGIRIWVMNIFINSFFFFLEGCLSWLRIIKLNNSMYTTVP